MNIFDVHSHWGTKRGYPLQSEAELAKQKQVWNSEPGYKSEDEMADYFRSAGVKTILDFGFTKNLPLDKVKATHDYGMEVQVKHPDVIHGLWLQIHPREGEAGVKEFERVAKASKGFIGYLISGPGYGKTADDLIYDPYCDLAEAAQRPILVMVGHTGGGAGLPGGAGMVLDHAHPRYIDMLAARRPNLTIIGGRPAWPWQDEMISVLLHKPNVWNELHGWAPKYFTPSLKHEIPRRLKNRIMFGADYPLFTYERLVSDWRALSYDQEVLAKVMTGNACRLFGIAA
jgi:predicted TIM-barrel fold metal-dependent hydrolase